MPIILIAGPSGEPVTAAEVKASARIDGSEFDSEIALLIAAVRQDAEHRLGRRLITQTVELVLDAFPAAEIDLGLPDVQSIASVKYLDAAGVEQTLASNAYSLVDQGAAVAPTWLLPAYGTTWPGTSAAANAVRVRFAVGYGATAAAVPAAIRQWIIVTCVAALNRCDVPEFVERLLDRYRIMRAF